MSAAVVMDCLVRATGSLALLMLLAMTLASYLSIPYARRRWHEHLAVATALFGFGLYMGVIWLVRP